MGDNANDMSLGHRDTNNDVSARHDNNQDVSAGHNDDQDMSVGHVEDKRMSVGHMDANSNMPARHGDEDDNANDVSAGHRSTTTMCQWNTARARAPHKHTLSCQLTGSDVCEDI
jgi:hypothetical protein